MNKTTIKINGDEIELKFKYFYKGKLTGYPHSSDKYTKIYTLIKLHWQMLPAYIDIVFDESGNFVGYFDRDGYIDTKEFNDILDTYFKKEYFIQMIFDSKVDKEKKIKAKNKVDKLVKSLERKVEKYYKFGEYKNE